MLRKLGNFLKAKIGTDSGFKKGLRVAQAIKILKNLLEENMNLDKKEIESMDFDYKEGYLIVQGKNRTLLQELRLISSSYIQAINKEFKNDFIKGIKTKTTTRF